MKTSKIILGGIAGAVAFFFLGWLVYGIILNDFMEANFNNCAARPMDDMVWWAIILSNLCMGFLIALVFAWANLKKVMNGVIIALILGFLVAASMDLSMYSMSTLFLGRKPLVVDIAVSTVLWGVVGFIVAFVMTYGKKDS